MSTPSKLRVLCLHGYRQSGEKLRVRMSSFRRALKSSVEFVFVDAPLVVPYEPTTEEHAARLAQLDAGGQGQEDTHQFSWFGFEINEEDGSHKYSNVTESIDYIANIYKEQGPFDGVFGFSQGGGVASLLLQLQQTKKDEYPFNFNFAIIVSAAPPKDERYVFCRDALKFPSLHVMGQTDGVVAIERSRALADSFENPMVFEHAGGHYIPANKEPKDIMRAFIKDMQLLAEKRAQEKNA